jgi:hypothetical protein
MNGLNGIVEMTNDEIESLQIHLKIRNKRQAHDPNRLFCICSKTSTCSRSDFCACKFAKRECTHLCGCGEPCIKRRMETNKIKICKEFELHHTRSLVSNQEMLADTNIKFEKIIVDDFLDLPNQLLDETTSSPNIENFQQQQDNTTSFYNNPADQLLDSNFITSNNLQITNMSTFNNNTGQFSSDLDMLSTTCIRSEDINNEFQQLMEQNNELFSSPLSDNNNIGDQHTLQTQTNTIFSNQNDQYIYNPLLATNKVKIEPGQQNPNLTCDKTISEHCNQNFHYDFQPVYQHTHSENQYQNNFAPFSSENIHERLENIEKSVFQILQFCEIVKNSNLL